MLSEKIKEFTKTNHQLLEKKLIGNIKSIRTKQDYAQLLGLFYSFFGGLESAIDKQLQASVLPDYSQRRKVAALKNDLTELCENMPQVAAEKDIPNIDNHLQALGALYVMEGSTLGGKIIAKMIQQQLNLSDAKELSFFSGYGENTMSMWHTFQAALNQPLTVQEKTVVMQSANDTFICFSHWFDQYFA